MRPEYRMVRDNAIRSITSCSQLLREWLVSLMRARSSSSSEDDRLYHEVIMKKCGVRVVQTRRVVALSLA